MVGGLIAGTVASFLPQIASSLFGQGGGGGGSRVTTTGGAPMAFGPNGLPLTAQQLKQLQALRTQKLAGLSKGIRGAAGYTGLLTPLMAGANETAAGRPYSGAVTTGAGVGLYGLASLIPHPGARLAGQIFLPMLAPQIGRAAEYVRSEQTGYPMVGDQSVRAQAQRMGLLRPQLRKDLRMQVDENLRGSIALAQATANIELQNRKRWAPWEKRQLDNALVRQQHLNASEYGQMGRLQVISDAGKLAQQGLAGQTALLQQGLGSADTIASIVKGAFG